MYSVARQNLSYSEVDPNGHKIVLYAIRTAATDASLCIFNIFYYFLFIILLYIYLFIILLLFFY